MIFRKKKKRKRCLLSVFPSVVRERIQGRRDVVHFAVDIAETEVFHEGAGAVGIPDVGDSIHGVTKRHPYVHVHFFSEKQKTGAFSEQGLVGCYV